MSGATERACSKRPHGTRLWVPAPWISPLADRVRSGAIPAPIISLQVGYRVPLPPGSGRYSLARCLSVAETRDHDPLFGPRTRTSPGQRGGRVRRVGCPSLGTGPAGYPDARVRRIFESSPGRDVVDVGRGTGIAAGHFRVAGCRVLGVGPDGRSAELVR